jgi:Cft2 family RNA processing exonuclease
VTRNLNWDRGVALPDHGLWLDPLVGRSLAFVSHAHSDHARRHQQALMTSETLALVALKRRPRQPQLIAYGEPVQVGAASLTLIPAGHMLGSAQLLFEDEWGRLLYTGDLKLRLGLGRPQTEVPLADVLIIESTYGQPVFRFPDPETVVEQVAHWCRRALESRVTPVLLAHAMGKCQELMLALATYGLSFALESRCLPHARAYEAAGVELPDYVPLEDLPVPGRVVIAPPTGKEEIRRLARYRTALVSGWAQDPKFRRIFGADVCFPYSDHCDFDELIRVVELSGASQVYTVHGFTDDLARHLRKRGVRASALQATEQLALTL